MIKYSLKRSLKTRSLKISVNYKAEVCVTAPRFLSEYKINDFVSKKENWILQKIKFFSKFEKLSLPKITKANYKDYKKQAEILVKERMNYFNKFYNFSFNKISIKKQKTRWGSCSKKQNLNFNYKIIFLPNNVADYLIVHELCHLGELNHSKNFWNLVKVAVPNYKLLNKSLKKYII